MATEHKRYRAKSLELLRRQAAELDCELVEARPYELLLDIDDVSRFEQENLDLVKELFGEAVIVGSWKSRGGGRHVRIRLDQVVPRAIAIALQAALGSDPKREIIACWESLVHPNEDTRSLFKPNNAEDIERRTRPR